MIWFNELSTCRNWSCFNWIYWLLERWLVERIGIRHEKSTQIQHRTSKNIQSTHNKKEQNKLNYDVSDSCYLFCDILLFTNLILERAKKNSFRQKRKYWVAWYWLLALIELKKKNDRKWVTSIEQIASSQHWILSTYCASESLLSLLR